MYLIPLCVCVSGADWQSGVDGGEPGGSERGH